MRFLGPLRNKLLYASDLYDIDVSVEELLYVVEELQSTMGNVKRLEKQNKRYRETIYEIKTIIESPITDFEELYDAIKDNLEILEESK